MHQSLSLALSAGSRAAGLALLLGAAYSGAPAQEAEHRREQREENRARVVAVKMGAYAFGGTVISDAHDSTLHCDHGYAEFFIPRNARRLPLVMWHSSSTKTWQTTFDGREGFQPIFVRRGWPVYLIDLPREGRAGWGCAEWTYTPDIGRDQAQVSTWRLGVWNLPNPPRFFPGVQFPTHDPYALDQLFRGRYPEFEARENDSVEVASVVALLDRIGPAVLLTHSGSGIRGWLTAIASRKVRAVVGYEPVTFVFPTGELPPPVEGGSPQVEVPLAQFQRLTRIPLQVVYGDNLERVPLWAAAFANARAFVDAVNRHGGDARLLHLPEIGIFGNTHFAMSDLNNLRIANLLSRFLHEKGLDGRRQEHSRAAFASK
jgi:hypothetical protein